MEQITLNWEPQRNVLTVVDLNMAIRALLDESFGNVLVAGEISGCKIASSGHYYFTLKDEAAQLSCVCFRMTARFLRFKPRDGVAVIARGRVDVFEARGQYQLIVESLEPQGHGALQVAFEQLKKKLAAEGLFEAARKRTLPKLPARIGIVTSPVGAAMQDILQVLARRFPGLQIRVYPAQVQGEGSVEAVCRGIEYFGAGGWADVIIVARGGGSLEDLWTFNEEAVARAIVASDVPVISAVGHETDFTIADFVADLRAPTPSAAAELVICTRQEILDAVAAHRRKLEQAIRYRLADAARALHEQGIDRATTLLHRQIGRSQQRIDEVIYRMRDQMRTAVDSRRRKLELTSALLRRLDVRLRFAEARRRVDRAEATASRSIHLRILREKGRLSPLTAHLTQLSPLRILERGYAIVLNQERRIVKSSADAPVGESVEIRTARHILHAQITQ